MYPSISQFFTFFAVTPNPNQQQQPPPPPLPATSPANETPAPSNRPPRGLPPNPRFSRDGVSPQALGPPLLGGPTIMNHPGENGMHLTQQGGKPPMNATRDARMPEGRGNTLPPDPQMQQRGPSLQGGFAAPLYPRSVSAQPALVPQVATHGGQGFPQHNPHFIPSHENPSLRAGPSRGPPLPFNQHPMPNPNNQPMVPQLPPPNVVQGRVPPDQARGIRKSPSTPSLVSQYSQPGQGPPPAMPPPSNGYQSYNNITASNTMRDGSLHAPQPRPMLPSALNVRSVSMSDQSYHDPSPPSSPVEGRAPTGPVTSVISAQMKCKVFLQQQHAQWKSLGAARLKLYNQQPTNVKQLVVEADNKGKSILISTIVLTDGVERVGKTGVAVELSDKGTRTGIVYMIQLRNETSAGGLFSSLLEGSDRSGR
jgi:hypothetical protein